MRFTALFSAIATACAFAATASAQDLGFTPVQLKADCEHVRILDPEVEADHAKVPPDLRYFDRQAPNSNLHRVTRYQRKIITLALNELPKLACSAVRYVAVYRQLKPDSNGKIHGKILSSSADAWVFEDYPNLINIQMVSMRENHFDPDDPARTEGDIYSSNWPIAISRIIHEAYHCAAHLLDANEEAMFEILSSDPPHWPTSVNKEAKRIMKKARLDGDSFTEKWAELQEDAVDDTNGPDYPDKDADDYQPILMNRTIRPPDGFMTHYARDDVLEDIAETASWVVGDKMIFEGKYIDPSHGMEAPPITGTWVRPCEIAKRAYVGGILEKQAALFLKLEFLVDVELIKDSHLKDCIGSSRKGLNKLDGKKTGFHFYNYEDGRYLKSYTTGFSITRTSAGFLRIKAQGSITKDGKEMDSYLEMQFRTTEKGLPRGYYKMTWAGNVNNPGPEFAACNHLFPLKIMPDDKFAYSQQVPDDQSQSYCAIEARVLVTNATEEHIELSMVLFKVARTGPIRKTPGVFDPPVQIVIRWKRNWNEEEEDEDEGPPVAAAFSEEPAVTGAERMLVDRTPF